MSETDFEMIADVIRTLAAWRDELNLTESQADEPSAPLLN